MPSSSNASTIQKQWLVKVYTMRGFAICAVECEARNAASAISKARKVMRNQGRNPWNYAYETIDRKNQSAE